MCSEILCLLGQSIKLSICMHNVRSNMTICIHNVYSNMASRRSNYPQILDLDMDGYTPSGAVLPRIAIMERADTIYKRTVDHALLVRQQIAEKRKNATKKQEKVIEQLASKSSETRLVELIDDRIKHYSKNGKQITTKALLIAALVKLILRCYTLTTKVPRTSTKPN